MEVVEEEWPQGVSVGIACGRLACRSNDLSDGWSGWMCLIRPLDGQLDGQPGDPRVRSLSTGGDFSRRSDSGQTAKSTLYQLPSEGLSGSSRPALVRGGSNDIGAPRRGRIEVVDRQGLPLGRGHRSEQPLDPGRPR